MRSSSVSYNAGFYHTAYRHYTVSKCCILVISWGSVIGWGEEEGGNLYDQVAQFMSSIATVVTVRRHWQVLIMSVVIQPLIDPPFDSSYTMQLCITWWNRGFPWNPTTGCCCNEVGRVCKHAREPLLINYWFEMTNLTELVMGVTIQVFLSGQCLG